MSKDNNNEVSASEGIKDTSVKRAPKRAATRAKPKRKRSHRASYPTPEFYFFAFLLNLGSVVLAAWLLFFNPTHIPLVTTGLIGVLGLVISVYSLTIRPNEANKKMRKILVGVTAAFGFAVLIAHAINILLHPELFIF